MSPLLFYSCNYFINYLRNKSEGFFIAAELLKKMCSTQEGLDAVHNLQGHLRRLNFLAQDLERKTKHQKRWENVQSFHPVSIIQGGLNMLNCPCCLHSYRNARLGAETDITTTRRFREIVNLLHLVAHDDRWQNLRLFNCFFVGVPMPWLIPGF